MNNLAIKKPAKQVLYQEGKVCLAGFLFKQ